MKKNVWLLGLVSFFNDIGSKMILPILPLFINAIGGGGLAVGLVSGVGDSIASFLKLLSGYYSDKIGKKKRFVFAGYATSAVSKLMLYFSSIWPHVLALRTTERIGKGLRSAPRDAILAAASKKEKRGKLFGLHRAMDSGGSVLGALITLVLFWYLGFEYKTIFLAAGIASLISLVPLIFVKEENAKIKDIKISISKISTRLKFFLVVSTLFAFANFSYMFFVLKSSTFFEGKLAIGIPIILYIIYNTSYTLFAIPSGMLSDRIGRRNVLAIGYLLFGIVCLGFIYAKSSYLLVVLFILYGLNYALVNSNERAYVSDLASKGMKGTSLGAYYMFTSLAILPGGLLAGLLWDLNTVYPFIMGLIIAVATSLLLASELRLFSLFRN